MKLPSREMAAKILADTHAAFHFGSVNKGSIPVSNQQFSFVNKTIKEMVNELKPLKEREQPISAFFSKKLKKISSEDKQKVKSLHENYIKDYNNYSLAFQLLSYFYTLPQLQEKYKNECKTEWSQDWFKDIAPIFALSELMRLQTEWVNTLEAEPKKKVEYDLYKKICKLELVAYNEQLRGIYFDKILMESLMATRYGVGNCEVMADFALLNAIEKSDSLACGIHYIRFLADDYEELNAIALGDWPEKGCLIVCPWLGEKGEIITWQGELQATTEVSHYSECKSIISFKPGPEMDKYRETLQKQKRSESENANRRDTTKSEIQQNADSYKKAFEKYFMNAMQSEHHTTQAACART